MKGFPKSFLNQDSKLWWGWPDLNRRSRGFLTKFPSHVA